MELLEIGEARLAYWDAGTGTPLLFIHGVGNSGGIWAADLAPLAADCRLVVYDRRGYGASSPSPRDWSAHGRDAVALIETLRAAPALIVGYSGGSMIALDVALRRPDLVAGIVLLDPAFNLSRCLTPGLVARLASVKLLRRVQGDAPAAAHWLRYVSSYATGGSAFDARLSSERRARLLANAPGIFDDMASGAGSVDERRLDEVRAPVTLVDAKLSPRYLRRSADRLARLLPRAERVTLDRSGHWVGVDARDELLDLLRLALGKSSRAAPG